MNEKNPNRTPRKLGLAIALLGTTLVLGSLLQASASSPVGKPGAATTHATPWSASAGDAVRFRARLDRASVLRDREDRVGLELVIGAPEVPRTERVPTDLVVVLDRSGSMQGRKIADARLAVQTLIDQLEGDDRMALVTYAQRAQRVFPLQRPTPTHREQWQQILAEVAPGGGTNLSAGLDLGLAIAESAIVPRQGARARRVVLLSDGLANQGDPSPQGLRARAARAVTGEFVLSTIGVGVDFDGQLMAKLADAGTGNFHYLETTANLARVLAAEFDTARETVVSALSVDFRPENGVRLVDAAGYPLERLDDGTLRFRPGGLFSGQERTIWLTLSVPAGGSRDQRLGELAFDYRSGDERVHVTFPDGPRLARVAEEKDYYAGFDAGLVASGVASDLRPRMQRISANLIDEGRAAEAVAALRAERKNLLELNEQLDSPAVAEEIVGLEMLQRKLEDHDSGKARLDKARVQQLRSLGYVDGRKGSRK